MWARATRPRSSRLGHFLRTTSTYILPAAAPTQPEPDSSGCTPALPRSPLHGEERDQRLVLPNAALPPEQPIDSVGRFALHFLKDPRERNGSIIVRKRGEDHVHVVGHYDEAMHGAFCAVDVKTGFDDNFPGGLWKVPSVVGRKRCEDCFFIFLVVRKCTAILVLPLHTCKLAAAGVLLQCSMDN